MFKKRTKRGNSAAASRSRTEGAIGVQQTDSPLVAASSEGDGQGQGQKQVPSSRPSKLAQTRKTAQSERRKMSLTELQSRYAVGGALDVTTIEEQEAESRIELDLDKFATKKPDQLAADLRLQDIRDALEEKSDDEWENTQLKRLGQPAVVISRPNDEIPTIESAAAALDAKIAEYAAETADLAARADALEVILSTKRQ